MIENRKNCMRYKKIEDIKGYVQDLMDGGTQIIVGEKYARIFARPGIPDKERVVSWSMDEDGNPVIEKETVVSKNETGIPDWVATKIDDKRNEIVDANGHINQWIIEDETFHKKYEAISGQQGIYRPIGGPQKFLRLNEGIHIVQWGEEWIVDAGGYINITNPEDMYVISARDFKDTYRVIL